MTESRRIQADSGCRICVLERQLAGQRVIERYNDDHEERISSVQDGDARRAQTGRARPASCSRLACTANQIQISEHLDQKGTAKGWVRNNA